MGTIALSIRAYVRKIAVELNPYDNVIYDICDEPNTSSNGSIRQQAP